MPTSRNREIKPKAFLIEPKTISIEPETLFIDRSLPATGLPQRDQALTNVEIPNRTSWIRKTTKAACIPAFSYISMKLSANKLVGAERGARSVAPWHPALPPGDAAIALHMNNQEHLLCLARLDCPSRLTRPNTRATMPRSSCKSCKAASTNIHFITRTFY